MERTFKVSVKAQGKYIPVVCTFKDLVNIELTESEIKRISNAGFSIDYEKKEKKAEKKSELKTSSEKKSVTNFKAEVPVAAEEISEKEEVLEEIVNDEEESKKELIEVIKAKPEEVVVVNKPKAKIKAKKKKK
jgi:hypothetical protein